MYFEIGKVKKCEKTLFDALTAPLQVMETSKRDIYKAAIFLNLAKVEKRKKSYFDALDSIDKGLEAVKNSKSRPKKIMGLLIEESKEIKNLMKQPQSIKMIPVSDPNSQ